MRSPVPEPLAEPIPTPEPPPSPAGGALAPALALGLAAFAAFGYLNLTLGWLWGVKPLALGLMLGTALTATAWLAALPARGRPLAALAVTAVVAALVFVDLTYFRYFMTVPSPRMLGYGAQMAKLPETQSSLVSGRDWLLLAPALLAAGSLAALASRARRPDLRGAWLSIGAGVLTVAFTLGIVGRPDHWMQSFRLPLAVKMGAVPMQVGVLVARRGSRPPPPLPEGERLAVLGWLAARNAPAPGRVLAGAAKGRDLIVIQVEALQGFVIGRQVDGRPVTPRLNALASETLYFPTIYGQTSAGGTSDAELLVQASVHAREQAAAFVLHAGNAYLSLPHMLRKAGYATAVLHANNASFWNRDVMYASLGIERYLHALAFVTDELTGIGLADATFLRQSLGHLARLPRPYAATLITLTSHYPFKERAPAFKWEPSVVPEGLLRRYLGHIRYTDAELGKFIDALKANGTWDRAVVVVYGDHPAIPFHEREALFQLVGSQDQTPFDWASLGRVPLFIHLPGGPIGERPIAGGQIDIAPTVANLLGVHLPAAFGQDLLNAPGGFVAFRNGSALDDRVYWHAESRTAWDVRTGQPASGELGARLGERAARQLRYSDAVLVHDLLRGWRGVP